jgi:hypothetical protein
MTIRLLWAVLVLGSALARPVPTATAGSPSPSRLTTFHEIVVLSAPASLGDDYRFGFPGVIAGNRLFVGQAQLFTGVAGVGEAYSVGDWAHQGSLNSTGGISRGPVTANGPSEGFGEVLAADGDRLLVGDPGDGSVGPQTGRAYLYERNLGGADNWGLRRTFAETPEELSYFGIAAAIDGDRLAISALGKPLGGGLHGTWVYGRNVGGPDQWGLVREVPFAGRAIALSGTVLVIGDPMFDTTFPDAGTAYVFEENTGGPGNWGLVEQLFGSGSGTKDGFGVAVDLAGTTLVVGARRDEVPGIGPLVPDTGSAYVFERNAGGPDNWGQVAAFAGSDSQPTDEFGQSVSIAGNLIAIGAWLHDGVGADAGAAYLFERVSLSSWNQVQKLVPSTPQPDGRFAESVNLQAGFLLTQDQGRAIVFGP